MTGLTNNEQTGSHSPGTDDQHQRETLTMVSSILLNLDDVCHNENDSEEGNGKIFEADV